MWSRENISHSATSENCSPILNDLCVEITSSLLRRECFGIHNYYKAALRKIIIDSLELYQAKISRLGLTREE